MGLLPDFIQAKRKDKVMIVDRQGPDEYRIIDHMWVDKGTRKVRYKDSQITLGNGHPNEHNNVTYWVDLENGNVLNFNEDSTPVLKPREEDLYLNRGIMEKFVESFTPALEKNYILLILALLAGIGIGAVVGIFLHSEFLMGAGY